MGGRSAGQAGAREPGGAAAAREQRRAGVLPAHADGGGRAAEGRGQAAEGGGGADTRKGNASTTANMAHPHKSEKNTECKNTNVCYTLVPSTACENLGMQPPLI